MRSTIMLGGDAYTFEATAGTAELFQLFTGKNLMAEVYEIREMSELIKKNPEEVSFEEYMKMFPVVDIFKRLAYVMNVQAKADKSNPIESIRWTKEQLNDDAYFAWLMGMEDQALSMGNLMQISNLWTSQIKSNVEAKN